MKKLIVICLVCLAITGCAPFQANFALYEKTVYVIPSGTNCVFITKDDGKSYGNNNTVIIKQNMVLWKSPTTNSSNSLPVTLPLMGL